MLKPAVIIIALKVNINSQAMNYNHSAVKLGDKERLDSEQPGNSEPLFDDKFAYLLTVVMR